MKKTILQMVLTCVVLGAVFFANDATLQRSPYETPAAEVQAAAKVSRQDSVKLPILMYHSILKDRAQAGKYVVSPVTLAADLDYLQAKGYETVTMSDLIGYVDGLTDLPEKPVMITFDDGHYNNYQYAYPLLKERGMRAVLSTIGTQTEIFTENKQENPYWSYLTAERLLELSESGVFEIQNHSYDLHENNGRQGSLRMRGEDVRSYRALLQQDTERNQKLLIDAGLPAPTAYVYPYGMYSRETEEIIRGLGFAATVNCEERTNIIKRDQESLYRLGRYNRPNGVSTQSFLGGILEE